MSRSTIRTLVLIVLTLLLPTLSFAQSTNPSEKSRKVQAEMNDAFKRWPNEDVPYILTPAERKAFLALRTNEERENFIDIFWRSRDPNPDTEENEYREEYYERIAYANEHFSSGIPGWKTDRGRIYITHGKPDSIESHPSGGSYDRPSYEGGGSTTTYPFEIWFYRHLDGVGSDLEIEFVDPTGTGEYRLARDADEKDALKNIPGVGLKTAEQLGLEPKGGRGLNSQPSYQREQDSLFSRLAIQKDLFSAPSPKFGDLYNSIASGTSGSILDKDPIEFDVRIDFFRQSDDHVITAFTVQTSNRELQFKGSGGLQTATMNILGRITAISGRRSGIFEDSVTTNATAAELVELRDRKSVYQKAIAMTPGTYKIDLVVRDVETGNRGVVNLGFTVPRYDDKKLSTSSLILASKLRATDERDIGQRFVIGNAKVIPNLSGVYRQGEDVGIYMQVYNAGVDQTTLRPAVDVEYVLTKDGKELSRKQEDWSGLGDSGTRLTLARLVPTTTLLPGDHEIVIRIRDRVGGHVIENRGKFTIRR